MPPPAAVAFQTIVTGAAAVRQGPAGGAPGRACLGSGRSTFQCRVTELSQRPLPWNLALRVAGGRLGSEQDAGGGYSGRRSGVSFSRQIGMAAAPGPGAQVVDRVRPDRG